LQSIAKLGSSAMLHSKTGILYHRKHYILQLQSQKVRINLDLHRYWGFLFTFDTTVQNRKWVIYLFMLRKLKQLQSY